MPIWEFLMLLVFDAAAPRPSEGGCRLRDHLTTAVARTAAAGDELVVLVNQAAPIPRPPAGMRVVECCDLSPGWVARSQWARQQLPALLHDLSADVVFASSGIISSVMKRHAGVVSTVNNMLPFTLNALRECGGLTARSWLTNQLQKRVFIHSSRVADAMVLHSEHALQQLARFTPGVVDRSFVCLTGVPERISKSPQQLAHPYNHRPYFFSFSVVRPYKNYLRLIDAYAQARQRDADLPDLVFAGLPKSPDYVVQMLNRIQQLQLRDHVHYLGSLAIDEIPAWLYHATANYFPSLVETNSVVQSEMLGIGAVQACSDIPPMNEVVSDAAELFDPRDCDSMAQTMIRLARDETRRDELRELSLARAEQLSWDHCGEAIWQAARHAQEKFVARGGSRRGQGTDSDLTSSVAVNRAA
jgi:glycosyltransferase involved in cell wall biosynthesis